MTQSPTGGPAQTTYRVTSRANVTGREAIRVFVVTDGRPSEGGPQQAVYYVSDAEVSSGAFVISGNKPIPITEVSAQGATYPAIAVYVVTVNSPSDFPPSNDGPAPPAVPVISSPSFAKQNTPFTNNMGSDGYSWAQARPITIDKYGKLFALAELTDENHCFVYSNDAGATWADGLQQNFLNRGTIAYDSVNDIAHVLWAAGDPNDGVIYRRYTIQRDGSNNITGFTRDTNVNLQLDLQTTGTMGYRFPCILWLNDAAFGTYGALLVAWYAANGGVGGGKEIRSSMRVLTNTNADNTASNWKGPVTTSTTTIGNAPAVPYSSLATAITGAIALCRKSAGTHALDAYIFYTIDDVPQILKFKRLRWNSGASDWSTGLTAAITISNINRSGGGGYSLKPELITHPHEDTTNDLIYLGFANWKSNTAGDTWSFVTVNGSDVVSSPVDVYSANGAHSYAPTGDILYDNTLNALAVSYIKTSTQFVYVQAYQSGASIQSETLLFNGATVDIPLLGPRLSGKLLCMFRDTVTPPRFGWFGTATWA